MKTHMFSKVVLGAAMTVASLFGSSQIARADYYHHRHRPGVYVNRGYGYGYSLRPPVYRYNRGYLTPMFVSPNAVGYGAGGFPINGGSGFSLYIGP